MAVPYGYWLNSTGSLCWGMKLWGDTSVTKEEYQKLSSWAPSDRHAALDGIKALAELSAVTEAHKAATYPDEAAQAEADAKFSATREALTDIIASMPVPSNGQPQIAATV